MKQILQNDDDLGEIKILEDLKEKHFEDKMPEIARNYLNHLKETLDNSFERAATNRNTRMELEQINHNRKIKNTTI